MFSKKQFFSKLFNWISSKTVFKFPKKTEFTLLSCAVFVKYPNVNCILTIFIGIYLLISLNQGQLFNSKGIISFTYLFIHNPSGWDAFCN